MKTINNQKHLLKSLTPRVRISIGVSFGCPCQARTDDTRINSPLLDRLSEGAIKAAATYPPNG